MDHISKNTVKFLKDLAKNNNRDWFMENKPRYEKAREEFVAFIEELMAGISKYDPGVGELNAKKAVFRIYRDTRFSKDKTPYKTNFGAHLVANAAKPHDRAGYYIHVEPGKAILAGGAYMPPGPWIKAIRDEIAFDPKAFKKIINHKDFKHYFGELEGEQLKTAPKGFPKDHPEIELLRYKSFLAVHNLKDKDLTEPGFVKHAAKVFKALKPFDDFLNKAKD